MKVFGCSEKSIMYFLMKNCVDFYWSTIFYAKKKIMTLLIKFFFVDSLIENVEWISKGTQSKIN